MIHRPLARLGAMLMLCVLAGGCATLAARRAEGLPPVSIAPAQLQMDVSLAQRLGIGPRDGARAPEYVDALLEIDVESVRLAGFAMGRRALALHYDGTRLREERAPELPQHVQAWRILRDVLYVFAPADALQAALPKGWHVADSAAHRELARGRRIAVRIDYAASPRWSGDIAFDNRVEGYRLTIETAEETPAR